MERRDGRKTHYPLGHESDPGWREVLSRARQSLASIPSGPPPPLEPEIEAMLAIGEHTTADAGRVELPRDDPASRGKWFEMRKWARENEKRLVITSVIAGIIGVAVVSPFYAKSLMEQKARVKRSIRSALKKEQARKKR